MVKPRKSTSKAIIKSVVGTPARKVAAGASQASHHSGQRPLRLLLIDDYAPLAEAMADWLREMGMEVRIAGSGNEALQATAVFRPEIVLCDMRLPDISGLDVARLLKAKRELANVFFVIHTAFGDTDIRTFEQAAGPRAVHLCFSKPITKEKLDRLLREFAEHSRLTDKRERTS
jgi:CheY-like chemotaxis protein